MAVGVILGIVFIVLVVGAVMRKRKVSHNAPSPRELKENPAYGEATIHSTDAAFVSPLYGACGDAIPPTSSQQGNQTGMNDPEYDCIQRGQALRMMNDYARTIEIDDAQALADDPELKDATDAVKKLSGTTKSIVLCKASGDAIPPTSCQQGNQTGMNDPEYDCIQQGQALRMTNENARTIEIDDAQALADDPELKDATDAVKKLSDTTKSMLVLREATLSGIWKLKHDVEESYDKSRKARVAGSTTSVVGGTLFIIGFGLSFVTLGASLGLTIAGGILGATGGLTMSGAEIGYMVVSKISLKTVQTKCDNDREAMSKLQEDAKRLASHLVSLQRKHPTFSEGTLFQIVNEGRKFALCAAQCLYYVNKLYKVVDGTADTGRTIYDAVRITRVVQRGVRAGGRTAWALGKAARFFSVGGVIVNAVFIPYDLAAMMQSAYDVHKYKGGESNSAVAKEIEKLINDLEEHKKEIEELQDSLTPDTD